MHLAKSAMSIVKLNLNIISPEIIFLKLEQNGSKFRGPCLWLNGVWPHELLQTGNHTFYGYLKFYSSGIGKFSLRLHKIKKPQLSGLYLYSSKINHS